MSSKQLCILVLCFATMLARSAVAQDEKNELGGVVGRTFISDQGIKGGTFPDPVIHHGKGLSFGVEYARRFRVTAIYAVSGEVVAMYNPDEDLNAGAYLSSVVPTGYKQLFVTPAARVNLFPTTAVSPWISLGVGFGHFSQASTLVYGGANPGKSTTGATIQGGIGLDVKVRRKMSIRGEVRDFWSGEPNYPLAPTGHSRQHNYFMAAGAFWRF